MWDFRRDSVRPHTVDSPDGSQRRLPSGTSEVAAGVTTHCFGPDDGPWERSTHRRRTAHVVRRRRASLRRGQTVPPAPASMPLGTHRSRRGPPCPSWTLVRGGGTLCQPPLARRPETRPSGRETLVPPRSRKGPPDLSAADLLSRLVHEDRPLLRGGVGSWWVPRPSTPTRVFSDSGKGGAEEQWSGHRP